LATPFPAIYFITLWEETRNIGGQDDIPFWRRSDRLLTRYPSGWLMADSNKPPGDEAGGLVFCVFNGQNYCESSKARNFPTPTISTPYFSHIVASHDVLGIAGDGNIFRLFYLSFHLDFPNGMRLHARPNSLKQRIQPLAPAFIHIFRE
jgi:hypothetical protein